MIIKIKDPFTLPPFPHCQSHSMGAHPVAIDAGAFWVSYFPLFLGYKSFSPSPTKTLISSRLRLAWRRFFCPRNISSQFPSMSHALSAARHDKEITPRNSSSSFIILREALTIKLSIYLLRMCTLICTEKASLLKTR